MNRFQPILILWLSGWCWCGRWMDGQTALETSGFLSNHTSPGVPEFSEPIRNVTVPLGREAVLSCVINNLAEYKVGWLRADDQTILSLHRRVVTHNPRVSVTHDESRTWNLHIRQIKESDQGCYMCQINTATMKKQLGCIQVQVPPDIVDERSTSDVTVNEGDNVTLTCTATGKPAPKIIWRREDGQKIIVVSSRSSNNNNSHNNNNNKQMTTSMRAVVQPKTSSSTSPRALEWASVVTLSDVQQPTTRERFKEVDAFNGETLRLYRVTRQMMAAYMCIASNDVPPAVSKRVPLNVNFPPLVTATMNVVGALIGNDVRLTCSVESHPPSINYWIKGRHQEHNTILPSTKYSIDGERGSSSSGYKTSMTLIIHDFQPQDRSAYICVAANSLGTAEASIQIYEVSRATAGPSATSRSVPSTNSDGYFIDDDDNTLFHHGESHSSTGKTHFNKNHDGQQEHNSKKHPQHSHDASLSSSSGMSMSPRAGQDDSDKRQEKSSSRNRESLRSSAGHDINNNNNNVFKTVSFGLAGIIIIIHFCF